MMLLRNQRSCFFRIGVSVGLIGTTLLLSFQAYADAHCSASSDPVTLSGGAFEMGAGAYYREEGPARTVIVPPFAIDRHEVTNRQFRKFVAETGYITVVEKEPNPEEFPSIPVELLKAGSAVFTPPSNEQPRANWWRFVEGAHWAAPEGPGSDILKRLDHPVVHISYEDAKAYANWAGGTLPTEAQWEFAARGGLDGATFEWGETPPERRPKSANTWQGIFPVINTTDDGHDGTAPVGCFPSNGYGLFDMTGNVWEWVVAEDETAVTGRIKGGSFLCSDSYCKRYRPAARHEQEKSFAASHIGFRVVYSVSD